jgi:hypothetical protein
VASSGNLSVTGPIAATLGPLSCNSAMNNNSQITADVETNTLSSSGFINGYVQTGVAAKTIPDQSGWNALIGGATTIPFQSTLDRQLIAPGVNTAGGGTNGAGVYTISVPALSKLTIRRSRVQATLLVSLGLSAQLVVQDENLWDPGKSGAPSLIVKGGALSSVSLSGSTNQLVESSGNNYNPAGAPYNGVSNSNTTDSYPNELHGLFHVASNISLSLGDNLTVIGCVVGGGAVTISKGCVFAAQPTLLSSPPTGYGDPSKGAMLVSPGTYRWVVSDVNPKGS